jgi:hypothetical protein
MMLVLTVRERTLICAALATARQYSADPNNPRLSEAVAVVAELDALIRKVLGPVPGADDLMKQVAQARGERR